MMAAEPWTPGPWRLPKQETGGRWVWGAGADNEPVAFLRRQWPDERYESNARLISLAPEMAEFIAEIQAILDDDTLYHAYSETARALLARARGETNP